MKMQAGRQDDTNADRSLITKSSVPPGDRPTGLLPRAMECLRWGVSGWVARRTAGTKRMEIVEALALGGRKQLLLVRCDEHVFLVGTGADQVQTMIRVQPELPGRATTAGVTC